jgi:hypothetical protein
VHWTTGPNTQWTGRCARPAELSSPVSGARRFRSDPNRDLALRPRIAAATGEAALAALGWALQFAADAGPSEVQVLVPATFEGALEHLLDAGAECRASSIWMSRRPGSTLDRYVLPSPTVS